MTIFVVEQEHSILGVPGRFREFALGLSKTFAAQKWSATRQIEFEGQKARITVNISFDDECKNGHNSFSITGDIRNTYGRDIVGGCIHNEVAKHFPELAHLIKWHLCSTDGPMHYIANTLYHAGDRDHNGKRAGEPIYFEHRIRFAGSPITIGLDGRFAKWLKAQIESKPEGHVFEVAEVKYDGRGDYDSHFTLNGFEATWGGAPFKSKIAAEEFAEALNTLPYEFIVRPTTFSKGKERQLDYARSTAIWPEATDEELMAEPEILKQKLQARLPALLEAFRADIRSIGFYWSPDELESANQVKEG